MISERYIDELSAHKYQALKSKHIFRNNLIELKSTVKADFKSIAELALPEVFSERAKFFTLLDVNPETFSERIIEIDEKKFILAGIRFRGLNVNKPFVSVYANFEIKDNKTLSQIADLLKKEFAVFRPQAFHFHSAYKLVIETELLEIDRYTLVGEVNQLLQREIFKSHETVELLQINNMNFYEHYLAEYESFHAKVPSLVDDVKAESVDEFKTSMDQNLVFKVLINGIEAGIVAGSAQDYYSQPGVLILEEILYEGFKGRGLGVYVQRAFIKILRDKYKIIWGTISHQNQASLKTAIKNHRKIEEIEYVYHLRH